MPDQQGRAHAHREHGREPFHEVDGKLLRRLRLLLSVFALGCGAAALWAAASLPSDRLASDTSSTVSAPRFAHDHPAHARPARAPTPP